MKPETGTVSRAWGAQICLVAHMCKDEPKRENSSLSTTLSHNNPRCNMSSLLYVNLGFWQQCCEDWHGTSHQPTNKTIPIALLCYPVTNWPNNPVYYILWKFIKIYVCSNLWLSKFIPGGKFTPVKRRCPKRTVCRMRENFKNANMEPLEKTKFNTTSS